MTSQLFASAPGDLGGLLFLTIVFLAVAFWLWMLIDCVRFETEGGAKLAWLLVILFVGIVGAPVYFFVRKLGRTRPARFESDAPVYQPWKKDQRIG